MPLRQCRHTELRNRVAVGVDFCSECEEMNPGELQLDEPSRNTHEFGASHRFWHVIRGVAQMKALHRSASQK